MLPRRVMKICVELRRMVPGLRTHLPLQLMVAVTQMMKGGKRMTQSNFAKLDSTCGPNPLATLVIEKAVMR